MASAGEGRQGVARRAGLSFPEVDDEGNVTRGGTGSYASAEGVYRALARTTGTHVVITIYGRMGGDYPGGVDADGGMVRAARQLRLAAMELLEYNAAVNIRRTDPATTGAPDPNLADWAQDATGLPWQEVWGVSVWSTQYSRAWWLRG